jgi:hypothetical protein
MNRNNFAILDTECIGLTDRRVYDIAWAIMKRDGTIIHRNGFVVREVITDADRMVGAHFHKKVYSDYIPMIADGYKLADWQDIIETMRSDFREHGVGTVCAYNMGFDVSAMRATHADFGDEERITGGDYKALCIWQFVCETILSRRKFNKIAKALGWFRQKTGNVFTNAEKAYAYISGEHGFTEDHTAASDVEIEAYILAACLRQKKKIPYNKIGGQPWRLAQHDDPIL